MNENTIKVLLSDDNVDFCGVLKSYLDAKGDIEVVDVAHDGESAFEKVYQHKPDVVILDGIMPKLDGLGFLEKVRQCDEKLETKFIMLTALTADDITQDALNLGVSYYMAKPFDMESLVQRIRTVKSGSGHTQQKQNNQISIEAKVTQILHEVGVPAHIRGYHYMRESIILAIDDIDMLNYITKELYPCIAKKYNLLPRFLPFRLFLVAFISLLFSFSFLLLLSFSSSASSLFSFCSSSPFFVFFHFPCFAYFPSHQSLLPSCYSCVLFVIYFPSHQSLLPSCYSCIDICYIFFRIRCNSLFLFIWAFLILF